MFNTLGKAIIAVSLCIQAFVLFTDQATISLFNQQANDLFKSCSFISLTTVAPFIPHLRIVTAVLLACSPLMIFLRYSWIKILLLVGLLINLFVSYNPTNKIPKFSNTGFWQDLAIIGGIVYLIGADVGKPQLEKVNKSISSQNNDVNKDDKQKQSVNKSRKIR